MPERLQIHKMFRLKAFLVKIKILILLVHFNLTKCWIETGNEATKTN